MKLLLAEMYDRAIAEHLRERGHDVVAVAERSELRGQDDAQLLSLMAAENRVVLTENAVRFVPAFRRMLQHGESCAGILISSPKSMPRGHATIGLYVEVLDRALRTHARVDALADQMAFLRP